MQSIYNLAKAMIEKDPHDLLYYNILAESYLMTGKNEKAIQLFDDVVRRDVSIENIRYVDDILHRAFCIECFEPIRGIRVKCGDPRCGYGDRCIPCFKVPHQCLNHYRIHIPSQAALSAMRFPHSIIQL